MPDLVGGKEQSTANTRRADQVLGGVLFPFKLRKKQ